ncbi:DUF429 domain-containing protein [Agrobacterium cavarae]|uniref:DUF429 domain-containing protein n=1 Tax=Agrobacterium cavarae TaxID=2528239 RepID=UPI0028A94975|nr:DUF429 domain-containing protein [Agrobacterium cavarae]
MKAILGIDAAWTVKEPSGIAVVAKRLGRWRLLALAPSYTAFLDETLSSQASVRHRGTQVEAAHLLERARAIAACDVDLVAIDMPLSEDLITTRRACDNLVSSAYGARHCATHTPSAIRPGKISDDIRLGFSRQGYNLLRDRIETPGLMEVYPHPARVELSRSDRRLPYKAAKVAKYWPDDTPAVRRDSLIGVWHRIVRLLDAEIDGVHAKMTVPGRDAKGWELKGFEDMLDAVVCAWVGIEALEGRAICYGDNRSAIWIPAARP